MTHSNLHKFGISCLIVLAGFTAPVAHGQEIHAVLVMDTNEILIGDQIELLLEVESSPGVIVALPQFMDTLMAGIEIVEQFPIDTSYTTPDSNMRLRKSYIITSFDSGYYAIPPFLITLLGDSNVIAETEALLLTVRTVEVDTSQAIKDIKAPLDAPLTLEEIIPYGITILAIILLGILLYHLYKRYRNRRKEPEVPVVVIPPHIRALENLKVLEHKKLWQEGKVKLYYTELTEIVRIYIEESFGIIAMELTSDEILSSIEHAVGGAATKAKLRQILSQADMVKFAKGKPLASDHELSMSNAYNFINDTKPFEVADIGVKTQTEPTQLPDKDSGTD